MTSKDIRDDDARPSDEPRRESSALTKPGRQPAGSGEPGDSGSVSDRGRNLFSKWWANRTYRTVFGVYIFLIVLILLSKTVSSDFGSPGFVRTVVGLSAFTAVAAFGQFIVVLTGGLDLSIPNVMTGAAVLLTGLTLGENSKAWWVLPLVLVLGAGVGVVNGLGIVYLRVSPVVMTLAVNVILSGAVLVYTNGTPKGRAPQFVVDVIQGKALGSWLPNIIVFLIIFLILGTILVNQTVFGRYVYASGSNKQVAYLSGVRVNIILVTVYAISGLCAALAGVMVAGYGNQSYLGLGDPYLVLTLAAVVLGGVNILGGRGLYVGVVGGAIILTTISTTLAGTSLPDAVKQIVYAVAIIAAVLAARQQQSV
jgi:ribose transport system permease protein